MNPKLKARKLHFEKGLRKVMKKIVAILFCLISITSFAEPPEKVDVISTKIVLENRESYFLLSDQTLWKVVPFTKRWRSISEWWNSVELVPKNYESLPSEWHVGSEIEIYSKYQNLIVDEKNASNEKTLKQCSHLLVNPRTGQVLFANPVPLAQGIVQIFQEGCKEGHSKGYAEGRLSTYQNAKEIREEAYAEGVKVGYTNGYSEGFRDARTVNPAR